MKPCPICGSKPSIGKFLLGCAKCSMFFSFHPKVEAQKESAIKRWNQRWEI